MIRFAARPNGPLPIQHAMRSNRLSFAAAAFALLLPIFLSAGCARRVPEAPYSATGVRSVPKSLDPAVARFQAQTLADRHARRMLERGLLLSDAALDEQVRTDDFFRAILDEIAREAHVYAVAYDEETRVCEVTVGVDPAKFAAKMEEARATRSAQTGR